MPKNIEKNTKITSTEHAYRRIKNMISNQLLFPGQQLVETALSLECGVSRTPVREAIRLLTKEGLVETHPNRGSFVRRVTREDVIMAFEVAAALEGMAAEICARRACAGELTTSEIQHLEEVIQAMEHCVAQGEISQWMDLDRDFHESIFAYAGNSLLTEKRQQIVAQVEMVFWFSPEPSVERHRQSCEDHRLIFHAITDKNLLLANEYGRKHRMRIRDSIIKKGSTSMFD
ncbi:MAG: GntR family transcriptional regulator [Eubacteriales bacterium]